MRPPGVGSLAPLLRRAARSGLPLLALLLTAACALVAGLILGQTRIPAEPPRNVLTVTVVNVQHGEASWVRTGDGKFIVIGGGPPEQGVAVAASLKDAGARKIDLLILPYPYAEAIGGVPELLKAFPVAAVLEPGGPVVNRWQAQARETLAARNIPVRLGRAGETLTLGGARVEVLAPAEPLLTATPASANNSLVVRLTWGDTRFLWAGGLSEAGETALLGRMPGLGAHWLRVARFGARDASSAEFLRLVSPDCAVVSVGPNRDGYPHPETLSRLAATGARVYRTDAHPGPLRFTSDGANLTPPE